MNVWRCIPRGDHHVREQLTQLFLHEEVLRCVDKFMLMRVVCANHGIGLCILVNIVVSVVPSVTPWRSLGLDTPTRHKNKLTSTISWWRITRYCTKLAGKDRNGIAEFLNKFPITQYAWIGPQLLATLRVKTDPGKRINGVICYNSYIYQHCFWYDRRVSTYLSLDKCHVREKAWDISGVHEPFFVDLQLQDLNSKQYVGALPMPAWPFHHPSSNRAWGSRE